MDKIQKESIKGLYKLLCFKLTTAEVLELKEYEFIKSINKFDKVKAILFILGLWMCILTVLLFLAGGMFWLPEGFVSPIFSFLCFSTMALLIGFCFIGLGNEIGKCYKEKTKK